MSNANLTPPAGDSRSSSPGAGEAKPRAVSGSLKDRIAKFNNPSAAPLVPTHAFGTAGPTAPSNVAGRGLIGNRIPSLDPRTAGVVGGQRKVSEGRGLIGNRIPSQSAQAGGGVKSSSGSVGDRSNSPAGSVGSSSASASASGQQGSSASPNTSRSSSPPTSPGVGGVPPSLLAATLPESGGPGAMTPSSTRAEAGEEVTEFSPPSTPTANPEIPQDDDMVRSDLTPNNLPANAVAANPMFKDLQNKPTPSITSSMASQYDSKGSEDQSKMLQDVSGVSTPTGTPRAAHRDLEGSLAGSARGEGSVADVDDLGTRLEGMDVKERDFGAENDTDERKDAEDQDQVEEEKVDRDPTPEPPETIANMSHDEAKEAEDDHGRFRDDKGTLVQDKGDNTFVTGDMDDDASALLEEKGHGKAERVPELTNGGDLIHDPSGALNQPDAEIEYTVKNEDQLQEEKPHIESTSDDRDPNEDDDLDALKRGDLHRDDPGEQVGTHTVDQNPVNNLVEASLGQNVAEHHLTEDETKHQGGVAGQRMEDVENADEIVQPEEASPPNSKEHSDGGPDIREATPVSSANNDEKLGEKGALDGPQRFEVEWLEKGRGQSKAVDLDKNEYHWHNNPEGDRHSSPGPRDEDDRESRSSQSDTQEVSAEGEKAKEENEPEEKSIESQEDKDKATLLPDAPSTEPKTDASRPMQIHIEPGLSAQPATDDLTPGASSTASIPDTSDEPTPSVEINPPQFPAPPSEDPDEVDPISHPQSGTSTPIDPSFVRSFPEVPDEEKPRVEVHVSSPVNTPQKNRENPLEGSTPLANIPGKSKSLSHPDLKGESEIEGGEEHKTPEGLSKRLSARRSPKSPLLDDEDPGDFEAGQGWAVVTKGRED